MELIRHTTGQFIRPQKKWGKCKWTWRKRNRKEISTL